MARETSKTAGRENWLRKWKERREFRRVLKNIYETEDGKKFFSYFLRHCHVTKSRFQSDPHKIVEQESLRRLAMSYLHVLGMDTPDALIAEIEAELRQKQQNRE